MKEPFECPDEFVEFIKSLSDGELVSLTGELKQYAKDANYLEAARVECRLRLFNRLPEFGVA